MTSILIVDDSEMLTELLGQRLTERGYDVTITIDPTVAVDRIESMTDERTAPDIALVDLSFPQHDLNGLDVLMAFHRQGASTDLVVYTQGDHAISETLALAWEAFTPTCCVSKLSPFEHLASTLAAVAAGRTPPNDPTLAPYLPPERSPWRSTEAYARLVPHGGHAKMWQGLLDTDKPPTYRQLSEHTGLAVNTLRNYREDLVGELELQGWSDHTLRSMHEFAASRRPLLAPFVAGKLAV